ncbi:MAG: phosphopantetheine-binding protein [Pirellulales bacterium]
MDLMTISSRTPEGQPTSCPLCLANVIVEPSVFIGDATCPRCGQLLWFIQAADQSHLFDAKQSQEIKDRLLDIIAANFRVERDKIANNPSLFEEIDADSLDVVELVMELEEELDMP